MSSISTMETLIFLKKVSLFNSFQFGELLKLKEITKEIEYEDGDVIIHEKEQGRDAYIIVSGQVVVSKNTKKGSQNLATLDKAACFGEMSILEDEPRSATVTALGKCTLLKIDGQEFRKIIQHNADLAFNMARIFSARYRAVLNDQ